MERSAETSPLVSLDTLYENLDGDYEAIENILEKFEATVLADLHAMEESAKKGEIPVICSLAHTVKGQCMLVEMTEVVQLAEQIEEFNSEKVITKTTDLIPILKFELQKGLSALKKARAHFAIEQQCNMNYCFTWCDILLHMKS